MAKPIQIELLRELSYEGARSSSISTSGLVRSDRIEGNDDRLIRLAVENSSEGIAILIPGESGDEARILFANGAFVRMTGVPLLELLNQSVKICWTIGHEREGEPAALHPLRLKKGFEAEARGTRKSGLQYSLEMQLLPVVDDAGAVRHKIAYFRDVSERKAQLEALEYQALHDALTGLPNRVLLIDRLEQAILVSRRTESPVALMMMDLDRFKEVNDTFGHHYGDQLLQQVAFRLREQIRESDTVARLGGDEFALVLPTVGDARGAFLVARKIVKALEEPFTVEGERLEIGASIGIAIHPEHGTRVSDLMRHGDNAMYKAKHGGLGISVYSFEEDHRSHRTLAMGAELRQAIEQDQLVLYYQPKVHLRSGLVTRVEALVRWQHPKLGLLQPDSFIPIAEKTNLINPLTEWVIDHALQQVSDWQTAGLPIHVAVNVSSKNLQEHSLPQTIATLLDKWKVEPRSLKLEITESSVMANPPHVLAILSLLQSLGVRLSLDDFGTGYSSLMHLRQLPVDEIKIDKSFVMGMESNESDAAIVRATIDLAHNLGRQVVAEGVDSKRTCETLTAMGCDLAQGYFLSPPLPAATFERWLDETAWGLKAWQGVVVA
ncbi:MAG TPA: EAL domain-containing protein [Thermoanaerobaculia bacterium]|nr:EAL domain-containing protein [Thermoanaerobaculia bacterium]